MGKKLTEAACAEFVAALASSAPVPGGGSAAALVGAVGAALGNMVGALTLGKKKYAAVEDEIQSLQERCGALCEKLIDLTDRDAEVFAPLACAYGMPIATEEQRAEKDAVMEPALCAAARVPLEVMELCAQTLDVIGRFAQIGSPMAVSDAGCAAACVQAALRSACLNVQINTKAMKNRAEAERLNAQAGFLLYKSIERADQIFESVRAQLN